MKSVSMEDFKKLEIRVIKVLDAKTIPGRTQILKLTVDVGISTTRTMIVGGAEIYTPEYFVGRKFVALVNLAPKEIAGIESQGMLLAADVEGKPLWLIVDEHVPIGTQIR